MPHFPRPKEIRALREQMGLTQTQFGELVYRSLRIVQDWEGGIRQCPAETWEYLNLLHEMPAVSRWRERFLKRQTAAHRARIRAVKEAHLRSLRSSRRRKQ
jgi:transcriptional regulator with XRE-family HTH domain